jgi:hypothetical protein
MNQLEHLAWSVFFGCAMLWIGWLDLHEGRMPKNNWPFTALAVVGMAGFVWWMTGKDKGQ